MSYPPGIPLRFDPIDLNNELVSARAYNKVKIPDERSELEALERKLTKQGFILAPSHKAPSMLSEASTLILEPNQPYAVAESKIDLAMQFGFLQLKRLAIPTQSFPDQEHYLLYKDCVVFTKYDSQTAYLHRWLFSQSDTPGEHFFLKDKTFKHGQHFRIISRFAGKIVQHGLMWKIVGPKTSAIDITKTNRRIELHL